MANINLPPVDGPDDYMMRRLITGKSPEEQSTEPTALEKKQLEDLKDIYDDDEKLFYTLDDKIEKIYKTLPKFSEEHTWTDVVQEAINDNIKKTEKHTVVMKLTNLNARLQKYQEETKKSIDTSLNTLRADLKSLYTVGKADKTLTKYDKMSNYFSTKYNNIASKVSNKSKRGIEITQAGFAYVRGISSCVLGFITGSFKAAWKIVDSIFSAIGGPVWTAIKNVGATIGKVSGWVINVGMSAISYVWKGFSTIFSFGFGVISKTVQYLAKGTKLFFGWWFKMLINTIFSPSMWLINIPIFLGLTFMLATVVGSMLTIGLGTLAPAVEVVFDTVSNVVGALSDWVWSGVSMFFGWIHKNYEKSGMKKWVDDTLENLQERMVVWIGGKPALKATFDWLVKAKDWVVGHGKDIINTVSDGITSFVKEFKGDGRKTWLERFTDFLEGYKNIPGLNAGWDFLTSKFGFSKAGGYTDRLRADIENEKRLGAQETLENAIRSLSGQNLDTAAMNVELSKIVAGLQQTAFGGMSAEVYNTLIENAKKRVADGAAAVDPSILMARSEDVKRLSLILEKIRSGTLDFNNIDTREKLDERLGRILTINASKLSHPGDANTISYAAILKDLQDVQQSYGLLRTTEIDSEYLNANADKLGIGPSVFGKVVDRSTLDNWVLKPLQAGAYSLNNYLGDYYGWEHHDVDANTFSSDVGASSLDVIDKSLNEPKLAHGAIVGSSMKNILPLDSIGREYIREQVKGIKIPDAKKIKADNDDIKNITIIEESTTYTESHEIYTMRLLSKGLLGAN